MNLLSRCIIEKITRHVSDYSQSLSPFIQTTLERLHSEEIAT